MTSHVAEVELIYSPKKPLSKLPVVLSPEQAFAILHAHWDHRRIYLQEQFCIMLLNHGKRCLGISWISSGDEKSTIVSPSTVYQVAILANASSIILCHNHPNGTLNPSASDIKLTKQLKEAGELFRIKVDDHIIMTSDRFYSFRDHGLL